MICINVLDCYYQHLLNGLNEIDKRSMPCTSFIENALAPANWFKDLEALSSLPRSRLHNTCHITMIERMGHRKQVSILSPTPSGHRKKHLCIWTIETLQV